MNKSKFSLNNIFQNNRIVLLISLAVAIFIWISITPNRETNIAVTVNIDTSNSAINELDLEILEGQGTPISVTVVGKWYEISTLTENDIKITPILSDVTKAGTYDIQIIAQPAVDGANFSVTKVTPDKIAATFDRTFTRPLEIVPKVSGVSAQEGLIADPPVVNIGSDTNIIKIKGPKSVIEKIDSIVAEVNVEETLSTTTSYTAPIKVLDVNGKEIDTSKLKIPITEAQVTIPIMKKRVVSVEPSFTNMPSSMNNKSIKYTLSSSLLELIGPPDVIDAYDVHTLEPIDFSDLTPNNKSFVKEIILPSGVKTTNGIDAITVNVDMSAYAKKKIVVKETKIINNVSNKNVTVFTNESTVEIVGHKSIINTIKSSDLYLEYDMQPLQDATGEHIVNAIVKSKNDKKVWGIGTYKVQIKIQ